MGDLDLGKLLRIRGMVTAAGQTEAVRDSARALARAYNGLRDEVSTFVPPELRDEFERLFEPLADPGEFSPALAVTSHAKLAAAAEDARLRLSQLGGWIHGLIEEITLSEQMRLNAEATAREQAKSQPGFS